MRYYFTIVDAEGEFTSDEGHEFPTLSQVKRHAGAILVDLVRDACLANPNGGLRSKPEMPKAERLRRRGQPQESRWSSRAPPFERSSRLICSDGKQRFCKRNGGRQPAHMRPPLCAVDAKATTTDDHNLGIPTEPMRASCGTPVDASSGRRSGALRVTPLPALLCGRGPLRA